MAWSISSAGLGQLSWLCFLSASGLFLVYSLVWDKMRKREGFDPVQELFINSQNKGVSTHTHTHVF